MLRGMRIFSLVFPRRAKGPITLNVDHIRQTGFAKKLFSKWRGRAHRASEETSDNASIMARAPSEDELLFSSKGDRIHVAPHQAVVGQRPPLRERLGIRALKDHEHGAMTGERVHRPGRTPP